MELDEKAIVALVVAITRQAAAGLISPGVAAARIANVLRRAGRLAPVNGEVL